MSLDDQRTSGTPNEQELVRRARQGNRAAWGELCHPYHPKVMAYLRRLISGTPWPTTDPEDLCQEIFLNLPSRLANFDSNRALWPFLKKITLNVFLSWLKKQKQVPKLLRQREIDGFVDSWPKPDTEAEKKQLIEALHRCIDQLPEIHREVVQIHYLAELQLYTVVESLGISVDSAKNYSRGARKRLAECLEKFNDRR